MTKKQLEAGPTLQPWSQAAQHARHHSRTANAKIAEIAGIKKLKIYHMENIKLFYDYEPNKDGYMGSENRRYWIINFKTGKKIRITEKQYNVLSS